jgi:hypothetical protein
MISHLRIDHWRRKQGTDREMTDKEEETGGVDKWNGQELKPRILYPIYLPLI